MGDTTSIYRDIILEHSRNPRNTVPIVPADFSGEAHNPLCGDRIALTLALTDGKISQVGIQARGCAIAQAGASLMSDLLTGLTTQAARALGDAFLEFLEGETDQLPHELSALEPLKALREHTSRIPCAMLAWKALDPHE